VLEFCCPRSMTLRDVCHGRSWRTVPVCSSLVTRQGGQTALSFAHAKNRILDETVGNKKIGRRMIRMGASMLCRKRPVVGIHFFMRRMDWPVCPLERSIKKFQGCIFSMKRFIRRIGCSIENMERFIFKMELSILRIHRSMSAMDRSIQFFNGLCPKMRRCCSGVRVSLWRMDRRAVWICGRSGGLGRLGCLARRCWRGIGRQAQFCPCFGGRRGKICCPPVFL